MNNAHKELKRLWNEYQQNMLDVTKSVAYKSHKKEMYFTFFIYFCLGLMGLNISLSICPIVKGDYSSSTLLLEMVTSMMMVASVIYFFVIGFNAIKKIEINAAIVDLQKQMVEDAVKLFPNFEVMGYRWTLIMVKKPIDENAFNERFIKEFNL